MKLKLCLGLIAMMLVQFTQAQFEVPQDYSSKMSYKESVLHYQKIAEDVETTILDQMQLAKSTENYAVDKFMTPDGPVQIKEVLSNISARADWMLQPRYFVTDSESISAFDDEFNLLKSVPHSEIYLETPDDPNLGIISEDALMLGSEELAQIGLMMELEMDGTIKYFNSEMEIIFNPSDLSLQTNFFEQEGIVTSTTYQKFRRVNSIEDQYENPFDLVVILERTEQLSSLPSGQPFVFCTVRTYSNYQIENTQIAEERSSNEEGMFSFLFPNPAKSQINIGSDNSIISEILIHDSSGKLARQIDGTHSGKMTIDVSDLYEGLYIISYKDKKVNQILKFKKS